MAKPFLQISGDAQRALEQFSTQFYEAFTAAEPEDNWSAVLGMNNSSRAIRTTYPIPISAAGYKERKGDDKMRDMFERSLSIEPTEWQDGVSALARIIEAPDFIGWASEPGRIAVEGRRHPNILVADMLHANPNLDFYKDKRLNVDLGISLFASNHPVNLFDSSFGTFDNDLGSVSSIDADLFETVFEAFRTRKGANGRTMRLRCTDLLVPPALEQKAKNFLQSDLQRLAILEGGVGAQKNTNLTGTSRWKGAVNLLVGDELEDDDIVYFCDRNAVAKPWIVQDGGEPEQIMYTKTDSLYKDSGKLGVKYVLLMAATACLPHAIMRATITG